MSIWIPLFTYWTISFWVRSRVIFFCVVSCRGISLSQLNLQYCVNVKWWKITALSGENIVHKMWKKSSHFEQSFHLIAEYSCLWCSPHSSLASLSSIQHLLHNLDCCCCSMHLLSTHIQNIFNWNGTFLLRKFSQNAMMDCFFYSNVSVNST